VAVGGIHSVRILPSGIGPWVFHRESRTIAFKEALILSGGWISVALAFNVLIFFALEIIPTTNATSLSDSGCGSFDVLIF
jgi:hypothetical protein